jgi:DUF1009 family protein
MTKALPTELGIIAGKGNYPLLLAKSARAQGVKRLFAVAFHGETEKSIEKLVDETVWTHVGKLGRFLEAFEESGVKAAVMAGQITPSNLFNVRLDKKMMAMLGGLKHRNADTIFGAIGDQLSAVGVDLLPAHLFMESCMPSAGVLTEQSPTDAQREDITLGLEVAKATSGLNIGQTVVVKEGTVVAVEAFEGTDQAILRGGEQGGKGTVVVKVARAGHDMRFDIPVIGSRTLKNMKKAGSSVLAVEAGRTIFLDQVALVAQANRQQLTIEVINVKDNE